MSPQPTLSNHPPLLIGITGGIGSGKSVVSHILRIAGLPVYDTDSEAKHIMDSPAVKQQISDTWGPELYLADGSLDRRRLAAIVFNDPSPTPPANPPVSPRRTQRLCEPGSPKHIAPLLCRKRHFAKRRNG